MFHAPTPIRAGVEQPGFTDTVVLSGLSEPTAVEFASDGRVFVAQKNGIIRVFPTIGSSTSTVFADLRTNVHNYWDRGLLGLALHPQFPADNRVYVLYSHDAAIGGTAPRWGDNCPTPPGATADGCVISGRLSVLTASGNVSTGEQVLIEDWCQQYPSHSIGSLVFGPSGELYASGGDGASFTFGDYGQDGNPVNPCGDPPGGVGGSQTIPSGEGGALRSQDLRTSRRIRRDWTAPSSGSTRTRVRAPAATPWPPARTQTPAASSRTASGTPSASPFVLARANCGSVTWVPAPGRRSTGSRIR